MSIICHAESYVGALLVRKRAFLDKMLSRLALDSDHSVDSCVASQKARS